MSWIDGTRIVDGDDSQGEDIYFFQFAPRLHTKDAAGSSNSVVELKTFGTDIQNGGSSIHVAYYDLIARNKVYGVNNSFERFKKIQKENSENIKDIYKISKDFASEIIKENEAEKAFCNRCNKIIDSDSEYCKYCGNKQ